MPKQPRALAELPPAVRVVLRELGAHLAIARKRRKQPMKAWAQRIGVSEPTLARLEQGDPGVSMGIYATALWLVGRAAAIGELAAPQHDLGALEQEVRVAQARAVRKPVSLAARLQADPHADLQAASHADAGRQPAAASLRAVAPTHALARPRRKQAR